MSASATHDPTAVALVTGAAKRIGRAIALDLAGGGWDVAVHYRSSEAEAAEVVAAIKDLGRRAVALPAELADEDQAAALLGRARDALGPVTLLVNNASIFGFDKPATAERGSWDRHMAINLRAPLVLTQSLLGQLPDDVDAQVVNIIDARVWNPTPNYTSYTISKIGLLGLTRHLAVALAPRVRVNGIGPGPVLRHPGMSEDDFDRLSRAMPLGRGATPEDVCRAVRFILGSPSVTGQMVAVDGGQHLGWLSPGQIPGTD